MSRCSSSASSVCGAILAGAKIRKSTVTVDWELQHVGSIRFVGPLGFKYQGPGNTTRSFYIFVFQYLISEEDLEVRGSLPKSPGHASEADKTFLEEVLGTFYPNYFLSHLKYPQPNGLPWI
jgi:hypothetical protein